MTINKTAYDTTIGRTVNISTLNDPIEEAIRNDDESFVELVPGKVLAITKNDTIPSFTLPIDYENGNKMVVIVDMRKTLVRENIYNVRVTNQSMYNMLATCATLNYEWLTMGANYVTAVGTLPMVVFAKLISECMGKNYLLNVQDRAIIEVLSTYYYVGLMHVEHSFADDAKANAMVKISRALRLPASTVEQIINNMDKLPGNINELSVEFFNQTQNINLKTFNAKAFLTITKSAWYGHDAAFVLACAFEHPPTWVGLVYAAVSETLYKRTGITRVADTYAKNDKKPFTTSVIRLLEIANEK